MDLIKPAIVIVAYNRTDSLKRLLNSISNAVYKVQDINLVISIDWSLEQEKVKAVADEYDWRCGKKTVRCFDENQGLRKHVLACGDLSKQYGAVIILEDDLCVADDFYNYAYNALNYYKSEERIAGIALYSHLWNAYASLPFQPVKTVYDTYCAGFFVSWGQAWSWEQWSRFKKWYNDNQRLPKRDERIPDAILGWPETSWGKYFAYYMASNELYFVIPYNSMSTNYHEEGVHSRGTTATHHVPLQRGTKEYNFVPFEASVKYDIFFERIFENGIEDMGISRDELIVDINGLRHVPKEKRYFLSSGIYDYPVVKTYGMKLRPIEVNVEADISGCSIFLYDLKDCKREGQDKKHPTSVARVKFDASGYSWRSLFPLATASFKRDLKDFIERKLRIGKARRQR